MNTWSSAAPSPRLWPRWQAHGLDSSLVVDHGTWDSILKKYMVTTHPSGVNRFRYGDVSTEDRILLHDYLARLQGTWVTTLTRAEQKAYWINLYNALTVSLILEHYPVRSIRDIDISPGFFSDGPWDAKLLTIEGERMSLNDIEHRVLRPIFKDNRVHYALNCASLGCPELQPQAFTSANIEELLAKGARSFINSPRGMEFRNGTLYLSNIYKWFSVDFGGTRQGLVRHLLRYARKDLARRLASYEGRIRYHYDWRLNDAR